MPRRLSIPKSLFLHFQNRLADGCVEYWTPDGRARGCILLSNLFNTLIVNLTTAAYLTGYCLSLGASPSYINTILLLMSLSSLVQFLSPFWMERVSRRKPIILALRATSHSLLLFFIPLVGFLPLPSTARLTVITVFVALSSLLTNSIGPGLQIWHIGRIPPKCQLNYFSFYNIASCVVVNGIIFLISIGVDSMKALWGDFRALSYLRFGLLLFAILDLWVLSRVPETPNPKSECRITPATLLRGLSSSPAYLRVILIAAVWSFAANIPSQYHMTYMLKDLHVSYTVISAVNLFSIVSVIFLTPLWKRLINQYSMKTGLFISILLLAPYGFLLFGVTESRMWLFPVAQIYYLCMCIGVNICFQIIPFLHMPEQQKTVFMASYNILVNLAATAGVYAGRLIYEGYSALAQANEWTLAPARVLVIVYGVALAAAAFAVRGIFRRLESGH